ncbi:hypothetical protein [Cardinium endosymbiont of Culicoides punctatus]|uniref:hypothetical protein n=1 Tax=Cardinium endosymbiont of Culicoides punctatus TaxID=2304601 RepID=UPI0010591EFD|nr:hypothetical protein [Cardinium endosymbiont of Culicoides punctatus]TDG95345.1 hypothetical protein CCPUN_04840 [Cardinium endosymbiont of Culicoides punctatus]
MHLFKVFRFLVLILLITTGCNKPNNLEMFRRIFKKNTNPSTACVKLTKIQSISEKQADCVDNKSDQSFQFSNTQQNSVQHNDNTTKLDTTQPLNHTNESNTTDISLDETLDNTKTNEQLKADLEAQLAELEKKIKEL